MQSGNAPQVNDYYDSIDTPDVDQMKLQLNDLVQQGTLSPEQAQAILVDRSAMQDIQADPNVERAQMDALSGLQDITNSGGMTAIDRSKLNQISQDEDAKQRGSREAILQNAEARGLGGSGIELLSQMQNQQDSATRQNTRDLDVAAQAQQRALDALMQQGTLAGNIRGEGFNEASTKAGAQDAISKFNAQNQQQVNLANTAANNAAKQANLAEKQRVADANTATSNSEQQYNKNLAQQDYENKLKKAQGQTGASTANAGIQQQAQQGDQGFLGGLISTAGALVPGVGGLIKGNKETLSDERAKEDIEPFDASEFLDTLTPSKFRYRDNRNGDGEQVGIMAQDMEKSDTGAKLVKDTPEGKVIEYGDAGPTVMASLASLHERMKKLEQGEE